MRREVRFLQQKKCKESEECSDDTKSSSAGVFYCDHIPPDVLLWLMD